MSIKTIVCETKSKVKNKVARASMAMSAALISSALFSPLAFAVLPTTEAPSGGTATGGLMANLQLYLKEYGALIGLVVCVVAFLLVSVAGIASFNEARKKGEWSTFGVVVTVGIILIVLIIWLANKASTIL
jgi:integrating conjugative element membrane protein (TIGR03745 family)